MKTTLVTILVLPLALTLVACGSSNRPTNPADIELSDSGVVWAAGELEAIITARAVDSDGVALEEVVVSLSHDGQDVSVVPAVGTTDANGEVEFEVSTQTTGPVNFQASLDLEGVDLGDPLTVDFQLQLVLTAGSLELTHPGGRISMDASVADSDGPVLDVPLVLVSDRTGDVITPSMQNSDSQGEATFEVTSQESGSALLGLEVDGLTMDTAPSVVVDFMGPTLSGTWSHLQPGALIDGPPRVGALFIEFTEDPTAPAVYKELTSVSMGPVPGLGDDGTFTLPLPMNAPAADLFRPDPADPTLPETFVIAPYAIVAYADVDGDDAYSEADAVLGISDVDALVFYAEGELPDPADLPDAVVGYQFMEMMEGDEEFPILHPIEELADQNVIELRSAPCPGGTLSGEITFGDTLDPADDTRVALLLIRASVIFTEDWATIFNVGNFIDLGSQQVTYAADTTIPYELILEHPQDVHPTYQDLLYDVFPDVVPAFGILAPMVYIDEDHNGVFTNDDDDINTGDRLVGMTDLEFGYDHMLVAWVDGPMKLFGHIMLPGLNPGYNLMREPLEAEVMAVVNGSTLQLDKELEEGHTGLPFRIEREVPMEDPEVILEGTDLSTGITPSTVVTSATGGFAGNVQVGDRLVITVLLEDGEVLDLDTAFNLATQ